MSNGINVGGQRLLTLGEINLAKTLYGVSIRYYENDFSMSHQRMPRIVGAHLFLHEMMHIWQHQHGMMVRLRGAFSWAVDYSYHLDQQHLSDYGMEQQASKVSDYWLLKTYGFDPRSKLYNFIDYDQSEFKNNLLKRYEAIPGDFPK